MSLMQIDEPADHLARPSTPPSPTPPPKRPRLAIPDQVIEKACRRLGRLVHPDDDEAEILESLGSVWIYVHGVLSHELTLSGQLANLDEFRTNVKRKGEQDFIYLLRDMARQKSWGNLLENEVFLKQAGAKKLRWDISAVSVDATVRAWSSTFRGDAANVLLATISNYLDKQRGPYTRPTCIVNSSGTGKSRMVDEVATKIITVPMCLRADGSQGFPPPDIALRNWFSSIPDPTNQLGVAWKLHGVICSLLTVLHTRLKTIASEEHDIPVLTSTQEALRKLSETERGEHASLVRQRQEKLAFAFRDRMTRGQSFQGSNNYRNAFYEEVIQMTTKFTEGSVEVPGSNPKSPSRYTHKMGDGVKEAGQKLCRFVDPHGLLGSDTGSRWPLVILAFDESHILTDTPKDTVWTLFSELRRTLRGVMDFPIFSLFLSTAGRFHLFSPEIRSDPSNWITSSELVPLDHISEISFDDLAFPAKEDTVTLDRVVRLDWISHLGRPLFGSHYDALGNNEAELMLFAKQKLLDGKSAIDMDGPGSLACLCVRFALEFNADALSRAVTCTQVERHMRLCVAATTGFERLVTITGSEPLLAEAASELMRTSTENPVRHLANHSDLNCVDRGRRGELVAAFIIMQARDASLSKLAIRRRWMSVSDFMQALLPSSAYDTLQNSLPTCWREGEDQPFSETFAGYAMWFNHVIRIEDGKMINAENLWKFITRGAMVMCANNQYGVDIVLPACLTTGNLSRNTVTAILIQVKNAERFECNVDKTLFDGMNPFRVGLFSDGQLPRPVIRVVFALASGKAGVLFPTIRRRNRHHADPFTAFDVWCAGLSPDTFRYIGDDLVPYQVLLERSLRPHDAFDLKETNDPRLDDETRAARGHRRRMMAALIMSQIGHNSTHV